MLKALVTSFLEMSRSMTRATVFRGLWNFVPSHGTCPFLRHFDIAAEFHEILQMFRNDQ